MSALVEPDLARGWHYPVARTAYDERDVCLYALGIGAGPPAEQALVYEGAPGFAPFPTWAAACALNALIGLRREGVVVPGFHFGLDRVLHGEHLLVVKKGLRPRATLTHRAVVTEVVDKGKNAVVVTQVVTHDDAGDEVALNELTTVVLGAGGFGGPRGSPRAACAPPGHGPDAVVAETTDPRQALLYRLSGDLNPLHADGGVAASMGFPRPILHGMCLLGMVARHVVNACAGGDGSRLRAIRVRFAESLFPGETLVTHAWRSGPTTMVLRALAKERGTVVVSHASAEVG